MIHLLVLEQFVWAFYITASVFVNVVLFFLYTIIVVLLRLCIFVNFQLGLSLGCSFQLHRQKSLLDFRWFCHRNLKTKPNLRKSRQIVFFQFCVFSAILDELELLKKLKKKIDWFFFSYVFIIWKWQKSQPFFVYTSNIIWIKIGYKCLYQLLTQP